MPRLETDRLLLRPPEYSDVPGIVRYLGDYEVAKNLANVPYPFSEADGRAFVTRSHEKRAMGEGFTFAILDKDSGAFMGICSLALADGRYKLGYWLGKPFWNQGFGTEAVKRLVAFAFRDLKVDTVWANWFDDNPVSGRILSGLGFEPVESYMRHARARETPVICHRTLLRYDAYRRKRPAHLFPAARDHALGLMEA